MKKTLFAMALLVSSAAMAEVKSEMVCNRGESGTDCVMVTYKVRAHKDVAAPYEACSAVGTPCAPTAYGVPSWLGDLNAFFAKRGYTAPTQTDSDRAP